MTNVEMANTVGSIGEYAFYNKGKLASINIPGSVKTIGQYAFYQCSLLSQATLNEGVKEISQYAFSSCTNLETIDFPASLTNMGNAVFSNSGLLSISLPETIKSLGRYVFQNCKSLETAVVDTAAMNDDAHSLFYGCSGLKSIVFGDAVTNIPGSTCNSCTSLETATIGKNVAVIAWNAFYECNELEKVIFADGLEDIGDRWFQNLTSLKEIVLPASLYTIGKYSFQNTGITKLELPAKIRTIEAYAFENCDGLTAVSIPASVQGIGGDDGYAFSGCSNLTGFTVNSANKYYVAADGVLFNKAKNTLVQYPAGKSGAYTVPASVKKINGGAFAQSAGLTAVTLPASVTEIGYRAFMDCTSLKAIAFPDNLQRIYGYTCKGCTSLEQVKFSDQLSYIGSEAFMGCLSLAAVTIPKQCYSISDRAFCDCALTSVRLPFDPDLGDYAFGGISVTSGSTTTYKYDRDFTIYGFPNGRVQAYITKASINFEAIKENVSLFKVEIHDAEYSGKAQTPYYYVSWGNWTIKEGTDYTISWRNNVNAGKGEMIITGKGNYAGSSHTVKFNIDRRDIDDANITWPNWSGRSYTGKAHTPGITAVYEGKTLRQGTDYTLSYKNNVNAGTATITVTGKGNFKDSISSTFTIEKAKQNITVKAKKITLKAKDLKKKKQTIKQAKAFTINNAKTKLTYQFIGMIPAKWKINKKTGAITVPKKTKKGTYKLQVQIVAEQTGNYVNEYKSVNLKVKVK